ncbi:sigma-70 family RNA polymerase sigma factor [Calidithermus chliarophilus]|uniref:sigma-70 family RNA polymerase sigma factor n=1 Tax=Calidithermus chliarophilus TaxID=52023 RepID=UPI00146FAC21|nr:sigma-70 family RNA polymerase sigma factor [Calidithermus chliarophilus]
MGKVGTITFSSTDEALNQLEISELVRIAVYEGHPDQQGAQVALLAKVGRFLQSQMKGAANYLGVRPSDDLWDEVFTELALLTLDLLPKYDPTQNQLLTFIGKHVYYMALNLIAKAHLGQQHLLSLEEMQSIDVFREPSVEYTDQIERDLCAGDVQGFTQHLTAEQRALLKTVYWEDKPQAEVARELGISRAAVSQRMRRIYQQGQRHLARWRGFVG